MVAVVIAGTNINLIPVEDGQAVVERQVLDGWAAKACLSAEKRTQIQRLGAWNAPNGIIWF